MFWQVEDVPSVPSVPDFQSIPGVPSVPCVPCFSNDPQQAPIIKKMAEKSISVQIKLILAKINVKRGKTY